MKITYLELINFRNLKEYKIEFDDHLTVLIADNGAGKTAILDAITVAIGPFVGQFPSGKNKGFTSNDATMVPNEETNDIEFKYPVKLNAGFKNIGSQAAVETLEGSSNDTYYISRQLTSPKSKTTTKDSLQLEQYAKACLEAVQDTLDVTLPIVSYYGTARLWSQIKLTQKSARESKSRTFAYHDCVYPESNYKEFEQWFIDLSIAEYDDVVNYAQNVNYSGKVPPVSVNLLLQAVRSAINHALKPAGWFNLRYNGKHKVLMIENNDGVLLPVESLSDGVKNMLALIGDISYRCAKLNPHLKLEANLINGIVLIDEIEMHLHPSWQQSVLPSLREIFPNIQFIISTHSPQVLSVIKKENIRIITPSLKEAEIPAVNPYGQASVVALEDVMNVRSKPVSVVSEAKLLDDYLKIINAGDINNINLKGMREKLEHTFGASHQKLMIADMIINRFKALQ